MLNFLMNCAGVPKRVRKPVPVSIVPNVFSRLEHWKAVGSVQQEISHISRDTIEFQVPSEMHIFKSH